MFAISSLSVWANVMAANVGKKPSSGRQGPVSEDPETSNVCPRLNEIVE